MTVAPLNARAITAQAFEILRSFYPGDEQLSVYHKRNPRAIALKEYLGGLNESSSFWGKSDMIFLESKDSPVRRPKHLVTRKRCASMPMPLVDPNFARDQKLFFDLRSKQIAAETKGNPSNYVLYKRKQYPLFEAMCADGENQLIKPILLTQSGLYDMLPL